ncbi:MAG: DUF349 domain-containing protein, partial [Salibacteraceae bacterium]
MSKEEIVHKLQTWLAGDTFAPDRDRIDQLTDSFKTLREQSREAQLKTYLESAEDAKEEDFEYKPDVEDARFDELRGIYNDKRKQAEKAKKEAEEANLAEKKSLVEELDILIKDEENIGKAYSRFNAIKQ